MPNKCLTQTGHWSNAIPKSWYERYIEIISYCGILSQGFTVWKWPISFYTLMLFLSLCYFWLWFEIWKLVAWWFWGHFLRNTIRYLVNSSFIMVDVFIFDLSFEFQPITFRMLFKIVDQSFKTDFTHVFLLLFRFLSLNFSWVLKLFIRCTFLIRKNDYFFYLIFIFH